MEDYIPVASYFADEVKWVDICDVPLLAFDHNDIVESALLFLRHELDHELTSELLPRKFTLSQLQELHEIVLDQKFDKRNFRKQVISKGQIKETNEKQKGVESILQKIKAEINRDMILMGCKSVKDLNRSKVIFRKD